MPEPHIVSIHGGHSGEFCGHASDTLQDIVEACIHQGFAWVGLTRHMPAHRPELVYPEEAEAGLGVDDLMRRFERYIRTARRLQEDFADDLRIFVGFETECYRGFETHLQALLDRFEPDYIVGSVHHVHDIMIDGPAEAFQKAAAVSGSTAKLYRDYFDAQFELIRDFNPAVVGHFDLIRLNDPRYDETLLVDEVWERIQRNLNLIARRGLILDYNVRALDKGASEPYVSAPILEEAVERRIALVPGDDAHAASGVGRHIPDGIRRLRDAGASLDWRTPV